jgi:hypothetical protein
MGGAARDLEDDRGRALGPAGSHCRARSFGPSEHLTASIADNDGGV